MRRGRRLARSLSGVAALACALGLACAPGEAARSAPARSSAPSDAPAAPAASAVPQPPAPRPVRIQTPGGLAITWTHLYVTQALGIFERHGLAVELVALPSSAAVAALQGGELDFMAAIGSAARATLRGMSLRTVIVTATGPDFMLLGAPGLTGVEQLRGKTIAGDRSPQANTSVILAELLRRRGLDAGQYEVVAAADSAARAAALMNGLVSATLVEGGAALVLERTGHPVLARAAEEVEMLFSGLATSTTTIQADRALVEQTVRAMLEGVAVMRTRKDVAVPIIARTFELSAEDAARVFDLLQPGWTIEGKPSAAAIQFSFEIDQRDLGLSEPVAPEQVLDFAVLDAVLARR